MKKIVLSLLVLTAAFGLMAQSRPFEESKTSYDPYIAEKGGFDSLFVNPAGMAGQSEYFVFEVEAGTAGATSTYKTIEAFLRNPEMLSGGTTTSDPTPADLEVILDLLAEQISQTDLNLLTAGSALDGMTPEQIAVYLDSHNLTEADVSAIAANADSNPTILEDAVTSLQDDLKVNVEATTKIGTLINGFGLGVYANAYSLLDAATLGVNPLIGETGVKLGYGFNLGPFAIGVSGDFAVIGNIASSSIEDIMNTDMVYGYAWGIDAGMTFDILPSLTVGAVLTDIIGSYSDAGTTSLQEIMDGAAPASLNYSYSFDLDLDFGITWAPQIGSGKIFAPKLHADYYDFISLFTDTPDTFQDFLNHMRFGAELELLSFINAKAMYYREFFTIGAGVDLLFFEVFGEFMFNQEFTEIGASALVKLHF